MIKHFYLFCLLFSLGISAAIGQQEYKEEIDQLLGTKQYDAALDKVKRDLRTDLNLFAAQFDRDFKFAVNTGQKKEICLYGCVMGYYCLLTSKPDSARYYLDKAIEFSFKYRYERFLLESTKILGAIQFRTVALENAEKNFRTALSLAYQLENKKEIANLSNNLGGVYYQRQELDSALHYYLLSLRFDSEIGTDSLNISYTLNNIGLIYAALKQYDKSIPYYNQVIEIKKNFNDLQSISSTYQNLGSAYFFMDKYQESIVAFKEGLTYFSDVENPLTESSIEANMATSFMKLEKFDSSKFYFEKAIKTKFEIGDSIGIASAYGNLGELYMHLEDKNKCYEYQEKSIEISKIIGLREYVLNGYQKIVDAALAFKDYEMLTKYYPLYDAMKDSLFNSSLSETLAETQTKYETEKKEAAIALLKSDNEAKESKLNLRKNQLIAALFAIIALAVGSWGYYGRVKAKQKEALNKAIIEEKEAGLKAVFDATEEERKRIAKELHDGIGQQMSGLKLAWGNLQEKLVSKAPSETEVLQKLTKILDDAANEVRSISHQMMPRALQENGVVSAINDMLEKSLGFSNIQFEFNQNINEQRFDERIELSLYRICQELINNIIKHSGANQVHIQLVKSKQFIALIIEDNGKGFNYDAAKKGGIGMLNMSSRINTLNGEINFEPGPTTGTLATIRIPIQA